MHVSPNCNVPLTLKAGTVVELNLVSHKSAVPSDSLMVFIDGSAAVRGVISRWICSNIYNSLLITTFRRLQCWSFRCQLNEWYSAGFNEVNELELYRHVRSRVEGLIIDTTEMYCLCVVRAENVRL